MENLMVTIPNHSQEARIQRDVSRLRTDLTWTLTEED